MLHTRNRRGFAVAGSRFGVPDLAVSLLAWFFVPGFVIHFACPPRDHVVTGHRHIGFRFASFHPVDIVARREVVVVELVTDGSLDMRPRVVPKVI